MKEEEFNKYVEMFETDGWKLFKEQVIDAKQSLSAAAFTACDTNEKWQFARGQVQELGNIAAYEDYIHVAYQSQLDNRAEDLEHDTL